MSKDFWEEQPLHRAVKWSEGSKAQSDRCGRYAEPAEMDGRGKEEGLKGAKCNVEEGDPQVSGDRERNRFG